MYLAKIKLILNSEFTKYPKDTWNILYREEEIECRWRYRGLFELELILGVFDNIDAAKNCGRYLYANILMKFLYDNILANGGCDIPKNEIMESIDIDKTIPLIMKGQHTHPKGLEIYEIDNSLDDFDRIYYLRFSTDGHKSTDRQLPLDDLQKASCKYSSYSQHIFNLVTLANQSTDERVYIPLLFRALEIMSAKNNKKSTEEINVIDECIVLVENSALSQDKKATIVNHFSIGKELSSRKEMLKTIEKNSKNCFDFLSAKKIFTDSYNLRNKIIHGGSYLVSKYPGEKH